ncbi:RanBP1 domain protein [Aspergillus tanneri]|nr:uncharacterized protein ATNIH1004_002395 [Aspergillus tanneri]KAA8649721.1 hypothetical protein ATNIH1004_002395 [Aspergillus tanneri]
MSTGASQQPAGSDFSGFKGNMFSLPPASPAPAQQPLPSGGLFGSGSLQNNTSGGLFGNNTTSAPSGPTGAATPTTTSTVFGQNNTTSSAPPTNIFGRPATDKPSPLSQSAPFGDSIMQTSPDAKSNAAEPKSPAFGVSQPAFNFASPGTGALFGGAPSTAAETLSKPLFGVASTEVPTPSTPLFGAAAQSSSAGAALSASTATAAPKTSVFGVASPTKTSTPLKSPFQSTNLFSGMPSQSATPTASEVKDKEAKKIEEPKSNSGFQFTPSTASGPSLLSKSETSVAPTAPASGLFQPPSTGNVFAPKPVAAEQDKPKPAEGNPFSSLFTPKPATPSKPATEQKPLPSSTPFSNFFVPKPSTLSGEVKTTSPEKSNTPIASVSAPGASSQEAKTNEQKKPATPGPVFSAPSPNTNWSTPSAPFTPQPSLFSTQPTITTPSVSSQSPFKVNNATAAPSTSLLPTAEKAGSISFEKLQPSGLSTDLKEATKGEVEMLHRIRMLNECFQREITRLDPKTDDLDLVIQYYLRVRETIGAPAEDRKLRRKMQDDEGATADEKPAKQTRTFGVHEETQSKGPSFTPDLTATNPAMTSPAQVPGTSQTPPSGNKRKSAGDEDDKGHPGKRINGDSTTANIFAQSFSKSKSSESDREPATLESAKLPASSPFKPTAPDSNKPSTPSTALLSSPSKPEFATPAKASESSVPSLFSQGASISKPTFTGPTKSASTTANPFVLKPSGDKNTEPALGVPKFGSGTTNFFAQFKAQADKNAEKEKAKRKAEDFDSDEEDEADWERKDAEEQRMKREKIESRAHKRPKFVPGKGFVFEDESNPSTDQKPDGIPGTATSSSASIFDAKSKSPATSSNIFGHLSATPSEAEDHDSSDDTEEASAAGDSKEETSKDASAISTSEDEASRSVETSQAEPKVISGSGAESVATESSDDGDFAKALQKSKQAPASKPTMNGQSDSSAGGRSLFDRVEYNQEGKLKRQGEEESKLSTFFNSSKYASSFNSPTSTPNPFAPANKPQADEVDTPASKPASPSIFGSVSTTSGLFGSPSNSGGSTPSIFAPSQNAPKAPMDNTWKLNSPIKFATESAGSTAPKSDSAATTSTADPSKPFSTLFGAASAGPKSSASGTQSLGFSFGGPSQSQSVFGPSAVSSSAASRSSTPGVTSDTGAEESGDADAAEALPQIDLARSGAGEENEDVVLELRARGMIISSSGDAWESRGIGFLRILKDRTTSRGRLLLRADPSGNIVLNTALMKQIKYTVSGTSVQFLVPKADGAPEQWAVRVKKEEVQRLATAIEETKN